MTRLTALLGFGCVLAACNSSGGGSGSALPDLEVSTLNLDFGDVNQGESVTRDITLRNNGELPMGLGQIVIAPDGDKGQDYEYNFAVTYDFADEMCDDGSSNGDTKDVSPDATTDDSGKKTDDSGKKTDDSGDTGYYDDSGDTGKKDVVQQVLNPGCELPLHVTMAPVGLGEVQAGLLIVTMDEPTQSDTLAYYRDPDEEFKLIKLEGNATDVRGGILFNPKILEFGFVWEGDTAVEYSIIRNVGGGNLTITDAALAPSCLDFNVTTTATDPTSPDYIVGMVLEPGESLSVPISYTPLDSNDPVTCTMKVWSDDPNSDDNGELITINANQPGLSEDTPPSVTLISPAPGYSVNSGTLTVELDMFDANQPANSLDCYIRSAVLKMASIANCTPTDESGHVIVNIDAHDKLEAGVDTIEVIVTDEHGQRATASTSIRYLVSAPDNDADGDGYVAVAFGGPDCDDNDITTYPGAAEIPDFKDNNCEPAPACVAVPCAGIMINPCVDEGTDLGDDDADCYVERCPEQKGVFNGCDCNDWETYGATTFPHAVEIADNLDNNCDGTINEGTSKYDDDGDGYDEQNGDCDDADPLRSPAGIEYCDGIDNDCDNVNDNAGGCIPIDSRPVILGGSQGVWAEKTDIGVNETTTLGVYGFDADGDTLTYVWTQDDEFSNVAIDPSAIGPVVTLTAPDEVKDGKDKYRYDIQVQVADPDGNLTWAYGYVWVHDGPADLTLGSTADSSGCNNDANQAFVPLLPLALLAWAGRRRRSQAAA